MPCDYKRSLLLAMKLLLLPHDAIAFQAASHLQQRKQQFCWSLRSSNSLVPEESPHAQPDQVSTSGVAYGRVLDGLHALFPPSQLDQRNALSRSDGYWPYLQRGDDPPEQLTYGEYDFYFFAQLLDRAAEYASDDGAWRDKTFCDLGSGTGRLVLAAAALHPEWKLCRGIEVLPGISEQANQALQQCLVENGTTAAALPQSYLPLAPIELCCGSLEDPYSYFGDADLVFVFSSCMNGDLMKAIGVAVGRQCQPGTLVITTDYMLPLEGTVPPVENDDRIPTGDYKLELIEKVEGWCWLTGGASTAFIHRVEQSLAVGKFSPPVLSLQERALQVVHAYESGTLTDTRAFLRNVYNNMVFSGLPDRFLPNLRQDEDGQEA